MSDQEAPHGRLHRRIDFARVNAVALPRLDELVRRWLPDGRRVGQEWVVRNPIRLDRHPGSFSINLRTGRWADLGDRAMSGLEHGAVAGSAATLPATLEDWRPILPVPDGVSVEIPGAPRSAPSQLWRYKDASGRLLGNVCRWETPKGKKILPLTYCENAEGERTWRFKQFREPRPLYRLDDLAARATATVLVCEGEKTADAAAALFPNVVATTSPGGANAAGKADWSPLAGRDLLIWPTTMSRAQATRRRWRAWVMAPGRDRCGSSRSLQVSRASPNTGIWPIRHRRASP